MEKSPPPPIVGTSDSVILCIAFVLLLGVGFAIMKVMNAAPANNGRRGVGNAEDMQAQEENRAQPNRRAAAAGGLRRRPRGRPPGGGGAAPAEGAGGGEEEEEGEGDGDGGGGAPQRPPPRLSKRQLARAAKAEAREEARRHAEARREHFTREEEKREEERRIRREEEEAQEREEEEKLQRQMEEEEKLRQEERDRWEEVFGAGDNGNWYCSPEKKQEKLSKLVDQLKIEKHVMLEDLASRFNIPSSEVIEHVQHLQKIGNISGMVDDWGRFIYISPQKMAKLVKYVNDKGTMTASELSSCISELAAQQ